MDPTMRVRLRKPVARSASAISFLGKTGPGLKEMAEVVGLDHVSIGTYQHVTQRSVADYTRWVRLVAAMLRAGFSPEETGKIAGRN
jgi:membrane dipeptidase